LGYVLIPIHSSYFNTPGIRIGKTELEGLICPSAMGYSLLLKSLLYPGMIKKAAGSDLIIKSVIFILLVFKRYEF